MRDIVVLIFTLGCIFAATKKPWWGVISLAIFSYLNPHAFAWGFVRSLPLYYILFLVVAFRTFTTNDKQPIPKDWRVVSFFLLWSYFIFTTTQAYYPEIARERLWYISKIYIPFIFTLLLINNKEKLYYLIITIGISLGIVAVKGGLFAIAHGFSYRIYGPPGTQFEENNAFAVATLIAVPLVLLWGKESDNGKVKKIVPICVLLMYISSLSSWSRGALLTMVALTFMLLVNSNRKYLLIPIILSGLFFAKDFLPKEWFNRMDTLNTYEEDKSAMTRIEAWTDGWHHTLKHPFTGSGFEGWMWVTKRDWHSSYVEMFSEHGFIAFGLWLSMILGTVISLTKLKNSTKNIPGLEWVGNYSFAIRTSLICYMVGTAFLGLSYCDLLYHLIFIGVLIKKFALEDIKNHLSRF